MPVPVGSRGVTSLLELSMIAMFGDSMFAEGVSAALQTVGVSICAVTTSFGTDGVYLLPESVPRIAQNWTATVLRIAESGLKVGPENGCPCYKWQDVLRTGQILVQNCAHTNFYCQI